jgi:hypothetical protein
VATIYAVNYNKAYVAIPSQKYGLGEFNGRSRVMYDSYTFIAESTSGDILKVGQIQAGNRVLSWRVVSPDVGGTGTINFGWAASADGVESAQATGFISAGDNSGQAYLGAPAAGALGLGKKFASACDLQIVLGTSASATAGTIQVWVDYLVD